LLSYTGVRRTLNLALDTHPLMTLQSIITFFPQVSERLVSKLRNLSEQVELSTEWKLEEAKLAWAEGERMHAIQLLKHLTKESGVSTK